MIANPNITATQQVKPADGELLIWACDQRDPRTLGPSLVNDARNLRYADGLPTTRAGVVKPGWANATSINNNLIGSLGVPYGSGVFRDPNGTEWQLVAAGGYVWRSCPGNGNVTVPLPAGVVILSRVKFVQAFDRVFLFRGRYLKPLILMDLDTGFEDLVDLYDPTAVYNAVVTQTAQAAEEMSYGPYVSVSALTWANGVATAATVLPHGYVSGSDVTVAGAAQSEFCGRWAVTVVDAYTFTYALKNATVATATGTITCSNNAYYWTALGSIVTLTSLTRAASASVTLTSLTSHATFTLTSLTTVESLSITMTKSGLTATAASAVPHGLVAGQSITIADPNNTKSHFTGTFNIATVPSAYTFTYTMTANPTATTFSSTVSAAFSLNATATYANHGLTSGNTVTIAGVTGANAAYFNLAFVVTVLTANTFEFALAANGGTGAASGTITCTPANNQIATATRVGHGFTTGQQVTIANATPSAYNGTFTILVISSSQFQYMLPAGGATSPAAGAITATIYVTSGTSGATATATAKNHGFVTGDYVTIAGAAPATYNGQFAITVTDANTFNFPLATDPGSAAAGVVTAQTSRVLAGQTPDTNPLAWTRQYDILPNAATALFINNLLLVPTAYEPSSVDKYATISGGQYSKVDFIVATNYEDYIHFVFQDEFRINQGGADEIVDLFKFGAGGSAAASGPNSGTVVVLKDKSWGVLTNVTGDLSSLALDMRCMEYGAAGPNTWAVVGANAYFLSPTYGVMVIRQSDLGVMLSVNVPLSAPIQKTISQVDWTKASQCRMSHWDNKLYVAVVLKNGAAVILVYDFKASVRMGNNVWESGVMTQGWTPVDTGSALTVVEFHRLTLNGQERHFFLDAQGYVNLMEESDCGDQVVGNGPQGLAWEEIDSYALTRAYGTSVDGQVRPVEECYSLATFNPCYTVSVVYPGMAGANAIVSRVTRSNTVYDRPFDALPWNPTNANDDWATKCRQDYRVAVDAVWGPNVVPGGQSYSIGTLNQCRVPVTQGVTYQFTPGANDANLANGMAFISSGSFVAAASTVTIYGKQPLSYGVSWPVTASVCQAYGLNLGSGFAVDQMAESLDTRRISGSQNKCFQLAIENTQGRIQLVGQRISSVPGRNRRGILT